MELRTKHLTIVIVASDNNPSILNPDFLNIQNIVPNEWGWTNVGSPISTPPFSQVEYDNGVSITVELNKINVVDKSLNELQECKIPQIITKYVETLPHVRYTGVGINFHYMYQHDDNRAYIMERFIKDGAWLTTNGGLEESSFRFMYPLENGKLAISLECGQIQIPTDDGVNNEEVIIVKSNFHRDCNVYPANEMIINTINDNIFPDNEIFENILNDILGVDDGS